jgi:hypothetical protein
MPPATLLEPLDPANVALACRLSDLAARLHPRRFPAGVHRYRSIEAARLARDAWERHGSDAESTARDAGPGVR